MAKNKSRSETEHLKGIIKNQRSIIKNLKKEVSRHGKRAEIYNDLEEKITESMIEEDMEEQIFESKHSCPNCQSELEVIKLPNRDLFMCECGYRKTRKSND